MARRRRRERDHEGTSGTDRKQRGQGGCGGAQAHPRRAPYVCGACGHRGARRPRPAVVYIDGEHGCFDWRDIEAACIAAERHGLTPIARIPDTSEATIVRFLDRGVRGIVAPHIESVADAQRVIERAYFAPVGNRSFGVGGAPSTASASTSRPAYMQACNAALSVCLMIESEAAAKAAGDLAALPGVDYLSFGMLISRSRSVTRAIPTMPWVKGRARRGHRAHSRGPASRCGRNS